MLFRSLGAPGARPRCAPRRIGCPLRAPCARLGRTLGAPWARLGRTLGAPWAPLARTSRAPWAHLGRALDAPWASLGRILGRVCRLAAPLPRPPRRFLQGRAPSPPRIEPWPVAIVIYSLLATKLSTRYSHHSGRAPGRRNVAGPWITLPPTNPQHSQQRASPDRA